MKSNFVVPGQIVREFPVQSDLKGTVVVGPGLIKRLSNDGSSVHLVATRTGLLNERQKNKGSNGKVLSTYWLTLRDTTYVAAPGDHVVGTILGKLGEFYRVDIGTIQSATLSFMAFEGATKRNRPNLKPGDVVYARVLVATSRGSDVEPEISCVATSGKSRGLGQLETRPRQPTDGDGAAFLVTVPPHASRLLLHDDGKMVAMVGKVFKVEMAVGLNGKVWIRSKSFRDTRTIANIIQSVGHEVKTCENLRVLLAKICNVNESNTRDL